MEVSKSSTMSAFLKDYLNGRPKLLFFKQAFVGRKLFTHLFVMGTKLINYLCMVIRHKSSLPPPSDSPILDWGVGGGVRGSKKG